MKKQTFITLSMMKHLHYWIPVLGLYWAEPRDVNRKIYEPYQAICVIVSMYIIWGTHLIFKK